MPGTVIGQSMNLGYPGTYARGGDSVIMSRIVNPTDTTGPSFGDPVILNAGSSSALGVGDASGAPTYSKMGAGGTMAAFAGVATRKVMQVSGSYLDQNTQAYTPGENCEVLERGSISVVCNVGNPNTISTGVYVRITANAGVPAGVVGGFEARTDNDSGNCILITNAKWTTGVIDANGVTELTILSRNLP